MDTELAGTEDKLSQMTIRREVNGWIVEVDSSALSRHHERLPAYVFNRRADMLEWLAKMLYFDEDDEPIVANLINADELQGVLDSRPGTSS